MRYWIIEFKTNIVSQTNAKTLILSDTQITPFCKPLYIFNNKWFVWSYQKDNIIKKYYHPGIKSTIPTNIIIQIPITKNYKSRNNKYYELTLKNFFSEYI